jgi:hypothetical protein
VHNFQFAEDRSGVVGEDHFLQVVDDDLVAAIGTQRCLDGLSNGTACVDVANDGAIL